MGQKEKEYAGCHGNLAKSTEGQAGPWSSDAPHLQVQVPCRNVSFEFERIAATRELSHLVLQIMRVVIAILAQRCLSEERGGPDTQPMLPNLTGSPSVGLPVPERGPPFPTKGRSRMLVASRQSASIYLPVCSSLLVVSGTAACVLSLLFHL